VSTEAVAVNTSTAIATTTMALGLIRRMEAPPSGPRQASRRSS
jgi:hypothetical protein